MRKLMIGIMPLFILLSGCSKKSSVGIIGGADGPTTIFITGSKTWFFISSFWIDSYLRNYIFDY